MNIITAIENKKINEQLKNINDVKILNSDIQYKEGILEYLEKNKRVEIIILKEDLPGQIKILELINEIKKINNKIEIIILIKENDCEKYTTIENVKYIHLEKITTNNILKILNINKNSEIKKEKNNIIKIIGNRGSGKTTFTIIFIKILSEVKNKKILLIDEDENKILTKIFFKNKPKNNILQGEKEIIKIENKIYLLNTNYFINKKISILEHLNKIKREFNYIIIDSKNNNYNKYEKVVNKHIFLLELNIFEIEKAKKYINKKEIDIIINKININNIDKEIIEKISNKKILGKINYSKNINLFINNNFNLNYLNKREKLVFLNLIEKNIIGEYK